MISRAKQAETRLNSLKKGDLIGFVQYNRIYFGILLGFRKEGLNHYVLHYRYILSDGRASNGYILGSGVPHRVFKADPDTVTPKQLETYKLWRKENLGI